MASPYGGRNDPIHRAYVGKVGLTMAQLIKRTTATGENRYDVRTRIGGRVVTRTFKRRKDADAYSSTIEADKLRGVVIDPRRARESFKAVATSWIKARTAKRASSVARDQSIIDNHLIDVLGPRPLGAVTRADIQSLVDSWSGQAPSTVGRQYSCLRAIFAWAESADIIARSPCRGIRLPQVRLVDRPALTVTQLERLAKTLGVEQAPMMWLGAVLGLRWGEAAALTVDRLNILVGYVNVDRQLARSGELQAPKSAAGVRTLACPVWLLDELAAVLVRRGLTAANAGELLFDSGYGLRRARRQSCLICDFMTFAHWRQRLW